MCPVLCFVLLMVVGVDMRIAIGKRRVLFIFCFVKLGGAVRIAINEGKVLFAFCFGLLGGDVRIDASVRGMRFIVPVM